jgi:hypothetical protein
MATSTADVILASASVFAAAGTVGTLGAAIGALRFEQRERARSEIRGFRTWTDVEESKERPGLTKIALRIENATQEMLFDVRARIAAPVLLGGSEIEWGSPRMGPTADPESQEISTMDYPSGAAFLDGTGAEAVFTDSRGHRWHRDPAGRLLRVPPVRWYKPWRVINRLDREHDPWWAIRTRWHYRWDDQHYRHVDKLPPPWWAIDIRWRRWRATRRVMPLTIPRRRPIQRWRERKTICYQRLNADLCLPWWAIDVRWTVWRGNRRDMRDGRREWKTLQRETAHYKRTGRRPDSWSTSPEHE